MPDRTRETVELTNMCMIRDPRTGKVLVLNRKLSYKGNTFPGGHLEPGEAVVHSVVREIKEETGLDIGRLRFCGVKDWMNASYRYIVFLFSTEEFSGTLIPEGEEGTLSWMTVEELLASQMAQGFQYTLQVFLEDKICEHYITPAEETELLL